MAMLIAVCGCGYGFMRCGGVWGTDSGVRRALDVLVL